MKKTRKPETVARYLHWTLVAAEEWLKLDNKEQCFNKIREAKQLLPELRRAQRKATQ